MKYLLLFGCAIAALVGVCTGHLDAAAVMAGITTMAVGLYSVGDGALSLTRALPTGASAVTSTAIDLGHGTAGANLAEHEFLLEAPAVTTGMLADAATIKYDVVTSASSDMSSPTTVASTILTQTGAASAGAAATSQRFRLPTNCQRYVGVKATKSAAGDASSVSFTLSLKF